MAQLIEGAPYVETNRAMLGDKHLDEKESVIRERERAINQASKCKIGGQAELENSDRSAGPRLHYSEIIRRIQSLNPRIAIRDGMPGNVAIYRPKRREEYNDAEREMRSAPRDEQWFWDHVYVSGMLKDWLPEYAHVTLDNAGLPTREVRGWRSVLIALVKSGAITRRGCNELFGDPSGDKRSGRWFEQIGRMA